MFLIRRDAWKSQAPATGVHRDSYQIAADEFTEVMQRLGKVHQELQDVESTLEQQGAPGRQVACRYGPRGRLCVIVI